MKNIKRIFMFAALLIILSFACIYAVMTTTSFGNEPTADITGDIHIYRDNITRVKTFDTEDFRLYTLIPDSDFYPYYHTLNENEQTLYRQIYYLLNKYEAEIHPSAECTPDEVEHAVYAVLYDHPEIFWADTSYSYSYSTINAVTKIVFEFNSTADDIEASVVMFDVRADSILKQVKGLSESETEKFIHDWLVKNVVYDMDSENNQSAYSALVDKSTVCAGYAKAFQYLMHRCNIPVYYVTGTAYREEHGWTILKTDDSYVNVDVTLDDTMGGVYRYYNKTDSQIQKSHTRDEFCNRIPLCN